MNQYCCLEFQLLTYFGYTAYGSKNNSQATVYRTDKVLLKSTFKSIEIKYLMLKL